LNFSIGCSFQVNHILSILKCIASTSCCLKRSNYQDIHLYIEWYLHLHCLIIKRELSGRLGIKSYNSSCTQESMGHKADISFDHDLGNIQLDKLLHRGLKSGSSMMNWKLWSSFSNINDIHFDHTFSIHLSNLYNLYRWNISF